MASHWTYAKEAPSVSEDLHQGDILIRTDELLGVLEVAHKHFCNDKFLAFVVLTQTCDLVQRHANVCVAKHITLAVVRSLRHVLNREIAHTSSPEYSAVHVAEERERAKQLVERIINQNEHKLGLFYLYPLIEAGIAEHAVVQLRVTISLRQEHYKVLQAARKGRIRSDFGSKMGWSVGNLYSRVATTDWADEEGQDKAKQLVDDLVDDFGQRVWAKRSSIIQAKKAGVDISKIPQDKIKGVIERHAPQPAKDAALDEVQKTALRIFGEGESERINKLVFDLRNSRDFTSSCRKG